MTLQVVGASCRPRETLGAGNQSPKAPKITDGGHVKSASLGTTRTGSGQLTMMPATPQPRSLALTRPQKASLHVSALQTELRKSAHTGLDPEYLWDAGGASVASTSDQPTLSAPYHCPLDAAGYRIWVQAGCWNIAVKDSRQLVAIQKVAQHQAVAPQVAQQLAATLPPVLSAAVRTIANPVPFGNTLQYCPDAAAPTAPAPEVSELLQSRPALR